MKIYHLLYFKYFQNETQTARNSLTDVVDKIVKFQYFYYYIYDSVHKQYQQYKVSLIDDDPADSKSFKKPKYTIEQYTNFANQMCISTDLVINTFKAINDKIAGHIEKHGLYYFILLLQ